MRSRRPAKATAKPTSAITSTRPNPVNARARTTLVVVPARSFVGLEAFLAATVLPGAAAVSVAPEGLDASV
jgi:hypothetical protein